MTAPTIADLATAVLTGSARPADVRALAARALEESALWRQREYRIRGLEADLVQARAYVKELEGWCCEYRGGASWAVRVVVASPRPIRRRW